jgi:outer membrane protein OmpA-like peptidoglycan-associated protein
MALTSRRIAREGEEESVFVSMTDLMISILFIVMIVMAFFAKSANKPDPIIEVLIEENRLLVLENQKLSSEIIILTKLYNEKLAELEVAYDKGRAQLIAKIFVLRDEITASEKNQAQQKILITALQELLAEERGKNAKLNLQNFNLEKINTELEQINRSLNFQIIDLSNQNDALNKTNEELEKIIIELRSENKNLEQANRLLSLKNTKLEQTIEELQQTIEELKKRLKELENKTDPDLLETVFRNISNDRNILLASLESRLVAAGIKVIVDQVSGVIRFGEDAIQFASASYLPNRLSTKNMQTIAEILDDELGCYTLGSNSTISAECNPNASIIEAVQIEGHTDLDGTQQDNLRLSTQRATSTYEVIITHRPKLENYLNANYLLSNFNESDDPGQQVLSVSGYGETRPFMMGQTLEAKRANRRIDLRFIMTTPRDAEEINKLKLAVQKAVELLDVKK